MSNLDKCYGLIPARYDSTRFPGKPLSLIANRPMFWHVYTRAQQCPYLDYIYLLTDHSRIYDSAVNLQVPVIMTSKEHKSGTDRILEASKQLGISQDSVVLNIQGDEPLLHPAMLTELLIPFYYENIQVCTLIMKISDTEAENPNLVKVVFSQQNKALYFSRSKIPFSFQPGQSGTYWGHIGLYGYKLNILKKFSSWKPGSLEQTEGLEQLRLLEAGIPIHVRETLYKSYAVDEPGDLQIVKSIIEQEQANAGNTST